VVKELLFWHEAIQGGAGSLADDVYNQMLFIPGV
jgi:hypothetical protein